MIEARNLSKRFRRVNAVDEVSFTARNGAITGLLGHNGAGKTTTLRMLYGLMKADGGQALVDEVDAQRKPAQAQANVGVMTDAHGLYPRLSALEHMAYFGRLRGMAEDSIKARSDMLVSQLHMQEIAKRRTEGFSHGEKMKVCLARSLIHDPGNIIMDEPTNGLDVMTTRSVRALLKNLRSQGKCILLSSHLMQEIDALCDEVVVIAAGRVTMQGSLEDMLRLSGEQSLEDAFVTLTGEAVT